MLTPTRYPRLLALAGCAVCAASGLLCLAIHLVLAARGDKQSELTGIWVLQPYYREQGEDALDPKLSRDTLTLNDDGTFTEQLENHVMMTLIMTVRGKYTRKGDTLTLTGMSEGYSDDGYRKGPFKKPFTTKLRYADRTLTMVDGALDGGVSRMVYRRQGEHGLPLPKVGRSDPRALKIVHEMERRYAALNSYSDEGTLTSSGPGFEPKKARFQTRFVRPRKFRFQLVDVSSGNAWTQNAVWSDGGRGWLYDGIDRRVEGSEIANALELISGTAGFETTLVPAQLIPTEFGGPEFDASSEEISLVGGERVSGKDCYVLGVSNPEGMRMKLWVEKTSYLILRAFESLGKETVTYQPKCNIKIADSEFRFTPPKE